MLQFAGVKCYPYKGYTILCNQAFSQKHLHNSKSIKKKWLCGNDNVLGR